MHVAAADLQHVDVPVESLDIGCIGDLGDDGEARLLARLGQHLERRHPEALEAVGRGAWLEGAASQHPGAFVPDPPSRVEQHLAVLDGAGAGNHHQVVPEADGNVAHHHTRPLRVVLDAGQLVWVRDADHLVDPVEAADVGEPLEVQAHDADDDPLLPGAHEGLQPVLLDVAADGRHVLPGRHWRHHHDH